MDGHGTGVRAQLYAFAAGSTPYNVTGWKNATRHTWGLTKTSIVNWDWKRGRTFPDGTRLCIVFNKAPGDNPLRHHPPVARTPKPAIRDAAVAAQRVAARREAVCTETLLVAASQWLSRRAGGGGG
jgi:hypothetical protein